MNVNRSVSEPGFEPALLDRCRRHDPEAFGKLVDAYQSRLFGFVRRMVADPEEAADVVQETFIRAFQAIQRFDGRSTLRTWLFRIAHNLCVDRARRAERAPQKLHIDGAFEDNEAYDLPDERWQPEEMVLDAELMDALEAGIGSMSEKLRSVLLLHDREDMSYDEIASALELPLGTVKSRLFLARAHLQNVLGAYIKGESHA